MQAQNPTNEKTAKLSSVQLFKQETQRLHRHPLSHIFVIVLSVFSTFCLLSIYLEAEYIFLPFQDTLKFLLNAKPWGPLVLINLIAGLVFLIVVNVGFMLLHWNACSNHFGKGTRTGMMMIVIAKFNQNILTFFSAIILGLKAIIIIYPLVPEASDTASFWASNLLTAFIVLIVLFTVFLFFLSFKTLVTVAVMKDAIFNFSAITTQYLFTAIGYFIMADIAIAIQSILGFNLTYTLGCVSAILFGIYCIHFRKTMRRIEANS